MKLRGPVGIANRRQPRISAGPGAIRKEHFDHEAGIYMVKSPVFPGVDRHSRRGFVSKMPRVARDTSAIAAQIPAVLRYEGDPEAF